MIMTFIMGLLVLGITMQLMGRRQRQRQDNLPQKPSQGGDANNRRDDDLDRSGPRDPPPVMWVVLRHCLLSQTCSTWCQCFSGYTYRYAPFMFFRILFKSIVISNLSTYISERETNSLVSSILLLGSQILSIAPRVYFCFLFICSKKFRNFNISTIVLRLRVYVLVNNSSQRICNYNAKQTVFISIDHDSWFSIITKRALYTFKLIHTHSSSMLRWLLPVSLCPTNTLWTNV